MKLLLDTHAFIWWNQDKERLTPAVLEACETPDNDLYLSLASIWEMQIKINLGKLQVAGTLPVAISKQCEQGIRLLEIRPAHVYATVSLPPIHGDPFDRLLVAQAFAENMTLITVDRKFVEYLVPVLW